MRDKKELAKGGCSGEAIKKGEDGAWPKRETPSKKWRRKGSEKKGREKKRLKLKVWLKQNLEGGREATGQPKETKSAIKQGENPAWDQIRTG